MKKLVIDLGLDPQNPCPDWDKSKSSVTDESGEKVGFVDMNDGLKVVVFVEIAA